jgi:hypothetical protein
MGSFVERYRLLLRGVLSCYDRILLTGTLPDICHAAAMSLYLRSENIRIFDFARAMQPLKDEIRERAQEVAREAGLEIEYILRKDFRKEDRIAAILKERGEHAGLVHIFSALEPCPSFQPWHDKPTGRTFLKPDSGKCLHYYFYFIDEALGLCFLRVPTWAPFRLQLYCNGHHLLAAKLRKRGIGYRLVDNVFVEIDNWERAQQLSDQLDVRTLHRRLNRIAEDLCPVLRHFLNGVHWSLRQVEYATDVGFRQAKDLAPIYEHAVRTAVHAVKAEQVATFLGKKLDGRYQGELGNDFSIRIQGTRIKHQMGKVSLEMYDKLGIVLRIETTSNDVTFFRHHRRVEHRDGSWEMKLAPLKKSIYSLSPLAELMRAANHRYLDFLAALDDPSAGLKNLDRISRPEWFGQRPYRGFNLFPGEDRRLFEVIARGEFNLRGFQNKDLRRLLPHLTGSQLSRTLKRLRLHGLIKKVGFTYKYYMTSLGRRAIIAALQIRELVLIPTMAQSLSR